MSFSYLAATAVRIVERIPAGVWAVWILAVILGTGILALRVQLAG